MKLMKRITIALVLCAIPAVAAGQVTTRCTGCTHMTSFSKGGGGFVAMATKGAKKVTWLATCSGIIRTGELTPDKDGMVSALFTKANGLACMAEKGGSFEVGPVMDGGWFWITDEKNSAVGLLIDKSVYNALKGDAVKITSAGAGVTMTAGMGAVYLKETATGRVGILPNILPTKPPPALRPCGFTGSGSRARKLNVSCKLGDGSAFGYASGTNSITGTTTRIPDGGSVTRPGGDGTLEFTIFAWMKPGGHFLTAASGDARLGHSQFAGTTVSGAARLKGPFTVSASVGTGPFGGTPTESTHGVTVASFDNGAKVTVKKKDTFCSRTNNVPLPLSVRLLAGSANLNQVTPGIRTTGRDKVVTMNRFTIVCPAGSGAASAHQGRELVPDNPFPVD